MAGHSIISELGAVFIMVLFSMILISLSGSALDHYKIKFIHESGVAIILGLIISWIIYSFLDSEKGHLLNNEVFLYYFLPPIIFAEGFNMKKKRFFRLSGYSILYGLIGTFLNFLFLYGFIALVTNTNATKITISNLDKYDGEEYINFNLIEKILLAASLSSKDSFAGATMIDHHKFPNLFSLIFSEGLINDATSLALFTGI